MSEHKRDSYLGTPQAKRYQHSLRVLEAEIERLRALLADKQYIQTLADYNRGHLSHAGWLKAREGK